MTSRLVSAMDSIATIWEALTPPSQTARVFRRAKNIEHVGHRGFYFSLAKDSLEEEFGRNFELHRYEFAAHVRIDLTGLDLITGPELRADDGILLTRSINLATSWSAGVRSVQVTGSEVQPTDTDDLELVLSIVALCEESDGS